MDREPGGKGGFANSAGPSFGRVVRLRVPRGLGVVATEGVPDEAKGEIPKACVVLKPGTTATAAELAGYCRQNIAAYKMPRVIEFLGKVPKTASGKTQRFLLRQRAN